MAINTEQANTDKKQNKSIIVVLLVVIVVLLIGGISAAAIIIKNSSKNDADADTDTGNTSAPLLEYASGAVALDADDLQSRVDEMMKQAEDGTMVLEFQSSASSTDGKNFTCHIGNAIENKYDMYINIFKDDTLEDEILLTGLLAPGTGIDDFESEIQLDPGSYQSVMILTQVSDDHSTIVSQLSVYLDLVVTE
jgi:hypothetical protein